MAVVIPVKPNEVDTIQVELDGRLFNLETRWSYREQFWYFNMKDIDQTQLLMGKKINISVNLLDNLVDERLPPGVLMALDQSKENRPPDLLELGERVVLLYFSEDELP